MANIKSQEWNITLEKLFSSIKNIVNTGDRFSANIIANRTSLLSSVSRADKIASIIERQINTLESNDYSGLNSTKLDIANPSDFIDTEKDLYNKDI